MLVHRPRRNRKSSAIRALVEETLVTTNDFIYPLFLIDGINRLSADLMLKEIESCMQLGIKAFAIFPAYEESHKDKYASESTNEKGLYLSSLKQIKLELPESCIMTDVAMDPYSSDGHDGLVIDGKIVNDATLEILAKMAVAQAATGIDIVGPSDMMDGRIGYIREALDNAGFTDTSIMAYTAKYASAFYGPFRDALDSAPKFGDKKTYQMNPANSREAMIEAQLDLEEGADFLMVKPALAYLDIIKSLKDNYQLPIAAYNVSGEYAMIKAASEKGWIDGEKAMLESLTAIKRAGADIILTYFAKEFAQLKKQL
jgi:porphobilinogen synthase